MSRQESVVNTRCVYLERMKRYQYTCTLAKLRSSSKDQISQELRALASANQTSEQLIAWDDTIDILRLAFKSSTFVGRLYFEYEIPRLGGRIDVVVIIRHVVFVLEFKTGAGDVSSSAIDQVTDYALDLRYFHQTSRDVVLAPLLVTDAAKGLPGVYFDSLDPKLLRTSITPPEHLQSVIEQILSATSGDVIDPDAWAQGLYEPTPTIVEAARALYRGHAVHEITRTTAEGTSLASTTSTLMDVIHAAQKRNEKAICFVTGVPGAGKTLVGLNLATTSIDQTSSQHCVYLSGNGPLVAVLREALVRDAVEQHRRAGRRQTKSKAAQSVKAFIQNVHHFRDDCIKSDAAPPERIVVFDEAQRAWNQQQTSAFMRQKKGHADFNFSEPEFLISCMDRHDGWSVIVCLVGNGQEINRGEAGIAAWLEACSSRFRAWRVFASPQLGLHEQATQDVLADLRMAGTFNEAPSLHLTASVRSFRSTLVSEFVNCLLTFDRRASDLYNQVRNHFPIVLTRDVTVAKQWVREKARGTERYGILASSAAQRLRPYAIDVTSKIDPVTWFLNDKRDVRSSYFLESVATEFDVQGLELDWTCLAWDADFRCRPTQRSWDQWAFRGSRWERINQAERKAYHVNAYRVLLTRARQGMVIVVPHGADADHTRQPEFYDQTYAYLRSVGIGEV
jgi:hypothetical protein